MRTIPRTSVIGFCALIALLAGSSPAFPQTQDCYGWSTPVVLEGFILDGVVPGPPEFESVRRGDAAGTAVFLWLSAPICVGGDDAGAEPIAAIELVQLACSGRQVTRQMRGERVQLKGELFPAHTGYHWTDALLACPTE